MDQFIEAFENLKKHRKNSVDSLIAWMKQTKLIDQTKEAEEKARKLFAGVKDAQKVEIEKFKEVVEKLAKEQHKTIEEFTKLLTTRGPKLMNALMAGASAFKDAFSK